jgi:hypothetical protein
MATISTCLESHLPTLLKLPPRERERFLSVVDAPVALLALLALESVRLRPLKLQPLDEPGRD